MSWKVGTARVKITPEEPLWMAGYGFRDHPATGTQADLWGKVLALEDATGQRAVLVTLDLLGIERSLSRSIMSLLEARCALRRDQVMICCSHTHCGPVVGRNLGPVHYERLPAIERDRIDAYVRTLSDSVVSLVGEALATMAPATLHSGRGQATFGVNRRTNPEGDVPRLRATGALSGPVDYDVPVLAVRDPEGILRAVVVGYACHGTVLCDYLWNADYPGYATADLESRYPGVTALFWNGCGSDVNPLPRRSVELAESYGCLLASAVATVLDGMMDPVPPVLQTGYREIELPMTTAPSRKDLQKQAQSDQAVHAAAARMHLRALDAGCALLNPYPYPVGQWNLGQDLCWVFLGGEVCVDYALRIKREHPGKRIWVAAYTNDVMGYIPSARLVQEGGYEANGAGMAYGLVSGWIPEIEDRIVSDVGRRVNGSQENC